METEVRQAGSERAARVGCLPLGNGWACNRLCDHGARLRKDTAC